ncbi:MAG: chloride channel protein [Bdellovibrionales bacterium]|nr:chloride channel protein [Bdellovibrionales bacterium]
MIKFLSSLFCLAGGGAIGREGPTLQISAVIFHYFGQKVRRFYPNSSEQTWVIAGAAAGLASAFNTPLGGIVYAIEELGMAYFHRIRTALLTAVIISGIVSQSILGSYLFLGYPRLAPLGWSSWPLILLTGFLSGLCGVLFSRGLLYCIDVKKKKLTTTKQLALFAVCCGLGASVLLYFNSAAMGPGTSLISRILFEGESASFFLVVSRILATGLAYLSGAAGGIFAPSLTIGASIGSKLAFLFGSQSVNMLAMIGMIGFLTGVTQAPFTSFILVL